MNLVDPLTLFTQAKRVDCDTDIMVFGVFVVSSVKQKSLLLKKLFKDLTAELEPWQKYYPWTEGSPQIQSVENYKHGRSFVFGSIEYGTSDEQWLVINLVISCLQRNKHGVDIVARFFDQDGEFLLSEDPDHLPVWCEPNTVFNRVWYDGDGHLMLIRDFENDTLPEEIPSLSLTAALDFLERKIYLVDRSSLHQVEETIKSKKLTGLQSYLKYVIYREVHVSEAFAKALLTDTDRKMNVLGRSLGVFIRENVNGVRVKKRDRSKIDELSVKLTLPFHFSQYAVIEHFPTRPSIEEAIIDGFISLSESDVDFSDYLEQLKDSPLPRTDVYDNDLLQTELLEKGFITQKSDQIDQESFEKELHKFREKEESKPDDQKGVHAGVHAILEEAKRAIEEDDFDWDNQYNDESDYTSDVNEEILEYFKKENLAIDEDDFFEFFLTEALKIPQEELGNYRAGTVSKEQLEENTKTYLKGDSLKGEMTKRKLEEVPPDDYDSDDSEKYGDLLKDLSMSEDELKKLTQALRNLSPTK